MDKDQFWQLVETARARESGGADEEAVAGRASDLLAARPVEEILAAQQALWDVMADSYTNPVWAAAYLINGGCSDDGFDYFRGWLLAQGRDTYTRVIADPDSLADLPAVRAAAAEAGDVECESVLGICWNAHIKATGEQLPTGVFTIRHGALDPAWNFDFDDRAEMRRRLPRLSALFLDER
ncbi:DUF4240 domain-containing protein [Streptomyces sp. NPDC058653]|uniref:DUF4240 domain-containing protein n=1 Tax=Streptomyces sp. NPDC058653 TaxID=3346576 RepID=UPI003661F002